MTKNQKQKERSARIAAEDVRILSALAVRLNGRALKLRTAAKLDVARRFLRRFRGRLPWHTGAHHVGRYDGGPMIFESKDGLAVDPRTATATA